RARRPPSPRPRSRAATTSPAACTPGCTAGSSCGPPPDRAHNPIPATAPRPTTDPPSGTAHPQMSSTRLLILGVVRALQPVHGYDVRRELVSWHAERWANVAYGSIYHALTKMTAEGLLEEVATEQRGNRPARTSYRITAPGETEFHRLLHEAWWTFQPSIDPFFAAISFMPCLNRAE